MSSYENSALISWQYLYLWLFLCVQLFQAEQRLLRSEQQLKDLRQAAADANPESE